MVLITSHACAVLDTQEVYVRKTSMTVAIDVDCNSGSMVTIALICNPGFEGLLCETDISMNVSFTMSTILDKVHKSSVGPSSTTNPKPSAWG